MLIVQFCTRAVMTTLHRNRLTLARAVTITSLSVAALTVAHAVRDDAASVSAARQARHFRVERLTTRVTHRAVSRAEHVTQLKKQKSINVMRTRVC